MTHDQFALLLDKVAAQLGEEVRQSNKYHGPAEFQQRVFDVLEEIAKGENIHVKPTFHPHAFPDIHANGLAEDSRARRHSLPLWVYKYLLCIKNTFTACYFALIHANYSHA